MMNVSDPGRWLPHRSPILMLDRVVEIDPGVSGTGLRRFQPGDACFDGHFPGHPVLPGVLVIEALAQTLLVVMLAKHLPETTMPVPELPLGYLARVREMSFQRPIEPGQEIAFAVTVDRELGQFTLASGRATHGETLCAKGSLAVAMDEKELMAALRGSAP